MKFILCATIALLLCFTSIRTESEEVTIETTEDDNSMAQPMVLDPEVAEEIRKEKEEEREHAKHAASNKNKTLDNVKPEIVVLYRPKLCKRQSNSGDLMVVHYTGWLAKSGRKFDTTIDIRRRYAPFEFVVGTGYVIKGWDKGLMDMCPGEKRKLIVPSSLGYGKKGLRGTIPRKLITSLQQYGTLNLIKIQPHSDNSDTQNSLSLSRFSFLCYCTYFKILNSKALFFLNRI